MPLLSSRGKPPAAAGAPVRPCLQISGQRLANYRQVRKPMQAGTLRSWSALPGIQLKWIHMRPDRQRHGASHDRAGRKGKPRKEAPRPSSGPPPLFCTLCALPADLRQNPPPCRMFPPFRDFRAELEAFTLAIAKSPPESPMQCGGLFCPGLSCLVPSCLVPSRYALTVYVSPCSSTRPCCNAGAPCPAVLSTCLHVYTFTCLHVYMFTCLQITV